MGPKWQIPWSRWQPHADDDFWGVKYATRCVEALHLHCRGTAPAHLSGCAGVWVLGASFVACVLHDVLLPSLFGDGISTDIINYITFVLDACVKSYTNCQNKSSMKPKWCTIRYQIPMQPVQATYPHLAHQSKTRIKKKLKKINQFFNIYFEL